MSAYQYHILWTDLEMEQKSYARRLVREGKAKINTYTYPDSFGRPVSISFYAGNIYP